MRIPGRKRLGAASVIKVERRKVVADMEIWLSWAVELQSISQNALAYCKDVFDIERFERIRDISAEILAHQTGFKFDKVKELFCCEDGYQTPKLDARAAVFEDGKILLVKEKNGKWSLPGGWVDFNLSVRESLIKEVKEESGIDVETTRVIAVQDREKHNLPIYAYKVCKIFILCKSYGGEFNKNIETVGRGFFSLDDLPSLAEEKNNHEQIRMCFEAKQDDCWVTIIE